MRKLYVLSIMMLMLLSTFAQTTYLVKDPCGPAFQKENPLLAIFTEEIPKDVSPEKALEAYNHPGKDIEYKSTSKPIYTKFGFWKNPIEQKDYVRYQEGKLIPQPSRILSSSEKFAWDNLICLIVLGCVSLLLSLFFWEKDAWFGDCFSLLSYILSAIACWMIFLFCGKSPGSDPLITIAICSSTLIVGLLLGYLIRMIEKRKSYKSAEEFNRYIDKKYGPLSKK